MYQGNSRRSKQKEEIGDNKENLNSGENENHLNTTIACNISFKAENKKENSHKSSIPVVAENEDLQPNFSVLPQPLECRRNNEGGLISRQNFLTPTKQFDSPNRTSNSTRSVGTLLTGNCLTRRKLLSDKAAERPHIQRPPAGHRFKKQNGKAERVISMKSLVLASESVGVICYDNTFWGTGFVVGGCFVLTAFHVVREMLGLQNGIELPAKIECGLSKTSCCIIFNYQQDLVSKYQYIPLKARIPFFSEELDVILLEMVENLEVDFPQSNLNFGDLQINDSIHFIGHPDGKPKQVDMRCIPFPVNENDIEYLRESLRDALGHEAYSDLLITYSDPYDGLEVQNKYFFNCIFEHTASGSPGIVVNKNGNAKVCTMLLGGYPNFYWDLEEETRAKIPSITRFEFGVKMSELYTSMKNENPELCGKVFEICPWN